MTKFLQAKEVTFFAYTKEDEIGIEQPIISNTEDNIVVDFNTQKYECLELQLLFDEEHPVPTSIDLSFKIDGDPLLLIVEPRKLNVSNQDLIRYRDYQIDDKDQTITVNLDPLTRQINIDSWGWINHDRKARLSISREYIKEQEACLVKKLKH